MALMSKRAQARTEKELHDLLKAPGNSTCADCGARNPSWASWSLGVFLCMRCASIHRKLGTHISKVKSLSMDTWTSDQVESMKRTGNLVVNKTYNPKNKRPDMPLDADEVDGAMERFIRKKYQEKSLSDGKPEVPSRDDTPPPLPRSKSPDLSPPQALPAKKGRFFGFGLRASSSAYPLSKHDKKHRNEPRVDSTFRISSDDYTSSRRKSGTRAEMSDYDLQVKLGQLRDMGFTDNERNTNMLKRNNGEIERTIAALVKLGPSEQPTARRTTPTPTASATTSSFPAITTQTSVSAPPSATTSYNPFLQGGQSPNIGLSFNASAPQSAGLSTNPWQSTMSNQPVTGLEQSMQNMQVSQPLFPHSTGGYPGQQQYQSQSIASQAPNLQQPYATTSSPVSMNNPFMQTPLSAHSTGSNPYAAHMQGMPNFAPTANPFLNMQGATSNQQATAPAQSFNPFGLPPSSSPPQNLAQPAMPQSQTSIFDGQSMYSHTQPQPSAYGGVQYTAQQQFFQQNAPQSPPAIPNFQSAQPQSPQSPQQYQQPLMSPQPQLNPYMQPSYQQREAQQSPPLQQQQQPPLQHNQQAAPHHGYRFDKSSILALYSHPELAPAKPLAPIIEPTDDQPQSQQTQGQQQITSAAPSGTIYGNPNDISGAKRSATMPASSMHSAGGTGSRNPFQISTNGQSAALAQGTRHVSHDSMIVNNPTLQDGRHSPDAFANLSSYYR